jgi:hypothetical protein
MPYWDDVRSHWLATVDAAERAKSQLSPQDGKPVTMRSMLPLSLRRPKIPIAVTGMGGAGKTMLYDALLGRVNLIDYKVKGRSEQVETHKSVIATADGKVRVKAIIVPGQDRRPRRDALEHDFSENRGPDGVVHVVCWGYNRVWKPTQRQAVLRDLVASGKMPDKLDDPAARRAALEAVRERNLSEEIEDFKQTCERLKEAWEGRRGWLVIAVAKCDLFWDSRDAARDYYMPGSGPPGAESEFCRILRELVDYIEPENCDVAVVPVSCYPESYMFEKAEITQRTSIEPPQISALISSFRSLVGEFCARS